MPPEVMVVFVPALWGAVFTPAHRPTLDPYDGLWVAAPKRAPDDPYDAPPRLHAPYAREGRLRHAEVSVGGFVARDEHVFSRTLGLRLFLGKVVVSGAWDRMYETPPEPGSLARLDFYRFHLSSNLLGGVARHVELYPHMGAALMKGKRATWAFDAGLEARVYPWRPLAIHASSIASVFKHGPALFDTRVEAGVAFERFELRGGVRWSWQHRAQGFAGPVATFVARF